LRDEPKGQNLDPIRPSDSVRLRARESDKVIGVADIIVRISVIVSVEFTGW